MNLMEQSLACLMSFFFTGLPQQLYFMPHKVPVYATLDKQKYSVAKGFIVAVLYRILYLEENCYIPFHGGSIFLNPV